MNSTGGTGTVQIWLADPVNGQSALPPPHLKKEEQELSEDCDNDLECVSEGEENSPPPSPAAAAGRPQRRKSLTATEQEQALIEEIEGAGGRHTADQPRYR